MFIMIPIVRLCSSSEQVKLFRWQNTLFVPLIAGVILSTVLLIQSILAAWKKRRESASKATTHFVKSACRASSGRCPKFADKHGGWLILACKVERFLGSAGLLGLSLYDFINEQSSRDMVGEVSLESRNLPQLGLVVTYVSCLLPSMV